MEKWVSLVVELILPRLSFNIVYGSVVLEEKLLGIQYTFITSSSQIFSFFGTPSN